MDVAALALNIDSSNVVAAANDLDKFSAAAKRAGAATGNPNGSIAKLVMTVQALDSKLGVIVGTLDKIERHMGAMSKAAQTAAAANDNMAASATRAASALAQSDAHVVAYTQHLAASGAAQRDFNAHVATYQNYLQALPSRQAQSNAHVEAYRQSIQQIPPELNRVTKAATENTGAMAANASNIAAQFQDIGVTAAMGMNPLLIGLQQGTQLGAAFQGGLGSLKAAVVQLINPMSLLGIALSVALALLIQWAIQSLTATNNTKTLTDATSSLTSAQSALGNMFDLSSGKIKDNTELTRLNTLAAIQNVQAKAAALKAESASSLGNAAKGGRWGQGAGPYQGFGWLITGDEIAMRKQNLAAIQNITQQYQSGDINAEKAMRLANQADLRGTGYTREQLTNIFYGDRAGSLMADIADKMMASFTSGNLDPSFLDPKKRKGGKTDAQKLADIYASAEADIAAEKTRNLASAQGVGAEEAARLAKYTDLLNSVQQKGIPVTDGVKRKIAELSDAYAKAKVAADMTEAITASTDEIDRQRASVADQVSLIGLYGDALARATREMEAQKKLRESLPKGEIVVVSNLTGDLSDDIDVANRQKRLADITRASADAAYAMDMEAKSIGLSGEALIAYNHAMDQKIRYQQAGIDLSPAEIAAIDESAAAYGRQRYAIDRQAQAISDAREITKGFFTDWLDGVRQGENVFKSFANSVIRSLNDIIDKMLSNSLTSMLGGSGGGGFLGGLVRLFTGGSSINILGSNSPLNVSGMVDNSFSSMPVIANANGGVYGAAQRFAQGGVFTNSIVSSPTLFKFANGGALGEMGEAGPEAIMPLKRGPDGKLGVHASGGGGSGGNSISIGDIKQEIKIDGGFTPETAVEMIRQGGEQTIEQVRRSLQSMLDQLNVDGALI